MAKTRFFRRADRCTMAHLHTSNPDLTRDCASGFNLVSIFLLKIYRSSLIIAALGKSAMHVCIHSSSESEVLSAVASCNGLCSSILFTVSHFDSFFKCTFVIHRENTDLLLLKHFRVLVLLLYYAGPLCLHC